ncbi:hypothetical protein OH77DRAFT_1418120 [Trametes cingulata]|nr:hypothetical protein OH77DRAFT_1418120 [Trametes cingulata]
MSASLSGPSQSSSSTPAPSKSLDDPVQPRSLFGFELPVDRNKKPVPKWLPVALLAFSTAAMVLPVVLLRRHRAAVLGKQLKEAPPPPTRRSTSSGVAMANPNSTSMWSSGSPLPPPSVSKAPSTKVEDNFNGALHCAKAFGIATFIVGVGAMSTVWGIRSYMGVETTQEFADRMRSAILTRMPVLSARIHRAPAPEEDEPLALEEAPATTPAPESFTLSQAEIEEWSWPAAERRLKDAFEKEGFSGWAAAALRELEAEGRLERSKRGHV